MENLKNCVFNTSYKVHPLCLDSSAYRTDQSSLFTYFSHFADCKAFSTVMIFSFSFLFSFIKDNIFLGFLFCVPFI